MTLVNAFVGGVQEMEKKLLPGRYVGSRAAPDGATVRLKQGGVQAEVFADDPQDAGQHGVRTGRRLIFVVCSGGLTTKAVTFFFGMAASARMPFPRLLWAWRCVHLFQVGRAAVDKRARTNC